MTASYLACAALSIMAGISVNAVLSRLHKRTMKRLRDDFRARFGEELDV